MGQIIEIPAQIRIKQTISILDPQKELREIIDSDLGSDAADLYDTVIKQIEAEYLGISDGDDYEDIADGYWNMLVDTMNELQEIVYAKRLDRNRLERLYMKLNNNL